MTDDRRARPNLFIVGAPKCGTTSLYEYLRQHPQIFFPSDERDFFRTKEPNHFCPELDIDAKLSIKDRAAYLALYADSDQVIWRGDASTHYLFSETAAERIKEFSPAARILITLRPPIDMMRSYHNDLFRHRFEDIADFHAAVAASEDRRNGLRIPLQTPVPKCLDYLGMSRFAQQIERYLRTFGSDAVKVVLLEDIAASPQTVFAQILDFLGVQNSVQPQFRIHNETPRSSVAERSISTLYQHPRINKWARLLVPHAARRRMLWAIRYATRSKQDPDPRDTSIRALCQPDVQHLQALIGRDLTHWL